MSDKIIIFTDGASKGNPGPGGFGAIIVLPEGKVVELGGTEKSTTNNRMELSGAISALEEVAKRKEEIIIYTDSKYLINGITKWIYGWQKKDWQTKEKKPVLNKDLWEKILMISVGKKIVWNYVGGHEGIFGNERCDEIASGFAQGIVPSLYRGSISNYKIDILNLDSDKENKVKKQSKGAKAYSYVSLVSGQLNIDKSWADCERRVRGKKGAKYKKAISPEQEKEIIRSWRQDE